MVISSSSRGSSKHRPGFHVLVLTIGFIIGGFMTHFCRKFLPAGARCGDFAMARGMDAAAATADLPDSAWI